MINIFFDGLGRKITVILDDFGSILSINVSDEDILKGILAVVAPDETNKRQFALEGSVDKIAATAIIAYLWNKYEIDAIIPGHEAMRYPNIPLYYHIRADGYVLAIDEESAASKPSYIIYLSGSSLKGGDMGRHFQECTYVPSESDEEEMLPQTAECESSYVSPQNVTPRKRVYSHDSALSNSDLDKDEDLDVQFTQKRRAIMSQEDVVAIPQISSAQQGENTEGSPESLRCSLFSFSSQYISLSKDWSKSPAFDDLAALCSGKFVEGLQPIFRRADVTLNSESEVGENSQNSSSWYPGECNLTPEEVIEGSASQSQEYLLDQSRDTSGQPLGGHVHSEN